MTKAYNTSCYQCDIYTDETSAYWIYDTIGKSSTDIIGFKNIRIFQCSKCGMIIVLEITER